MPSLSLGLQREGLGCCLADSAVHRPTPILRVAPRLLTRVEAFARAFGLPIARICHLLRCVPRRVRAGARLSTRNPNSHASGGPTWNGVQALRPYSPLAKEFWFETRAVFLSENPGGYPLWAAPVSVDGTSIEPMPIDLGRASEIGIEKVTGCCVRGKGWTVSWGRFVG